MAKLERVKVTAETNNALESTEITLANTEILFDVIISKLYSEPHLAVAREIGCNMLDASVENNKGHIPTEITLPTYDNNNIVFKDYGIGINKERMENFYTKVGNSSKRASENQIGQFGMGRLSILSVSPSFTLTTTTDDVPVSIKSPRVKRIYSVFLNERRTPSVNLISEAGTTEPTGTTVSIPVQSKDFSKFIDAVTRMTQFWKVRPKTNIKLAYKNYTILHSGTGWEFYQPSGNYYDVDKSFAIIGGIPYAIDAAQLHGKYKDFVNHSFFLHFNIGELSLSASRDSIHYDQKSDKAISAKLETVMKEFCDKVSNAIKSAKTYPEAVTLFRKTTASIRVPAIINGLDKVLWDGHVVHANPRLALINEKLPTTSYIYRHDYKSGTGKVSGSSYWASSVDLMNESVAVFWDDKGATRPRSYVEQMYENAEMRKKSIILFRTPEALIDENGKEVKAKYDTDWIDLFGIEKLSEIDLTKVFTPSGTRIRTKNDEKTVSVYELYNSGGSIRHNPVQEVKNAGGIYTIYDYEKHLTEGLDTKMSIATLEKFLGQKVYGITKVRSKKLNAGWKTVKVALEEKIAESLKEISKDKLRILCKDLPLSRTVISNSAKFEGLYSKLDPKVAMILLRDKAKETADLFDKHTMLIDILRVQGEPGMQVDYYYNNSTSPHVSELTKLLDKVKKNYLLIDYVSNASHPPIQEALAGYINRIFKDGEK